MTSQIYFCLRLSSYHSYTLDGDYIICIFTQTMVYYTNKNTYRVNKITWRIKPVQTWVYVVTAYLDKSVSRTLMRMESDKLTNGIPALGTGEYFVNVLEQIVYVNTTFYSDCIIKIIDLLICNKGIICYVFNETYFTVINAE